ncbi:MAG: hypothetical protein JST49_06305 [Bacteroidetes bacterium]|nr:hypothetical protein [Bacteroidota bacterium]
MKRLLLLTISVIVALLIAEAALRLVFPEDEKYYIWQPNLHHVFHPDTTVFDGIAGDKEFSINSTGARGDVFTSATKNYVCVGGSTTECVYLDNHEAWPYLLQQRLGKGYTISSVGKSGVTTREHYLHVKYTVRKLEHVNGVILSTGINDFMKCLSQGDGYNDGFEFTKQVEDSLVNTIFLKTGRRQYGAWWRRTAIFNLIKNVYSSGSKYVAWQILDDNGANLNTWRANRASAAQLLDTMPNLEQALDEYERNLQLIYNETKAQGLDLICVSQPAIYTDSMSAYENSLLWMGGVGAYQSERGHIYYSAKALRQGLDRYNQRLQAFCMRNGIHFLDANAALPRNTTVFYDDCHFNKNGAQLLSKYLAQAWPHQ